MATTTPRTAAPVAGGVYVPPAAAPDETAPAFAAAAAVERWVACLERPEDCLACGACERVCVRGAVALAGHDDDVPVRINAALCSGCGDCVEACPQAVLALRIWETGS